LIAAVIDFLKDTANQITAVAVSAIAMLAPISWAINIVINYRTYREQVKRTQFVADILEEIRK
jgi:hypothetical protein